MNDPFYTPDRIAEYVIRQVSIRRPDVVADFAAGDGALLRSASRAWPSSKILAIDIDSAAVRKLRYNYPSWLVGKCDFLQERSRKRCHLLNDCAQLADLVLLNPPFSCRGGSTIKLSVQGSLCLQQSYAFVLQASQYLSRPSGCGDITGKFF